MSPGTAGGAAGDGGAGGGGTPEKPGKPGKNIERWQAWRLEHGDALVALQEAQRAYHRIVAGGAFRSSEDRSPTEHQREAIAVLDIARKRLDTVRARKPEEPV